MSTSFVPKISATGNADIERVRGYAVRLPLPKPVGAGATSIASRDYLCIEVTLASGVTGIGFSYIGTRGAESALTVLRELILPLLASYRGNFDQPDSVQRHLMEGTKIQGRAGLVMNVISAIDIAIWDAASRRRKLPLAALLGSKQGRVPAYASGGYYKTEEGLAELDEELATWRSLGFIRMKLKMKGLCQPSEVERMRRTRSAMGNDGLLMLDLYHAFHDRDEAVRFVESAIPFRPYWIEDPFQPDDIASFAWLARRTGQRVATGEFQSSPLTFRHIGLTGGASVVQAEAPRCGGVTGWLELAGLAEELGMMMGPCWFHQLHMHLVPAVPHGLFVEYFHGTDVLNFDLLLDSHAQVEAGEIVIPTLPGLGFGFDWDRVNKQAVASIDVVVEAEN